MASWHRSRRLACTAVPGCGGVMGGQLGVRRSKPALKVPARYPVRGPRGMGGLAGRGFRWAPAEWLEQRETGELTAGRSGPRHHASRCLAVSLPARARARIVAVEDRRPGSDGRGGTLRCSSGVRSEGGRSGWRRCALRWCRGGGSTGVAAVESCGVLAGSNGAALGQLIGARRQARRTPRRQRRRAGRDRAVVPR
jgi:hypothetical protein